METHRRAKALLVPSASQAFAPPTPPCSKSPVLLPTTLDGHMLTTLALTKEQLGKACWAPCHFHCSVTQPSSYFHFETSVICSIMSSSPLRHPVSPSVLRDERSLWQRLVTGRTDHLIHIHSVKTHVGIWKSILFHVVMSLSHCVRQSNKMTQPFSTSFICFQWKVLNLCEWGY